MTQETITLDGKTFLLWYNTPQQRQMALDEYYRQRKYGVMSTHGDEVRKHFGVMDASHRPNRFGMM